MFLEDRFVGDQIVRFLLIYVTGCFCVLFMFIEVIPGSPFLRYNIVGDGLWCRKLCVMSTKAIPCGGGGVCDSHKDYRMSQSLRTLWLAYIGHSI
jgi:hypothetical protein